MALSHRQLLFIDHYMKDGNASAASVAAGYKSKPNVNGSQLLANPNIAAEVKKRQESLAKKNSITLDEIVSDLKTIRSYAMTQAKKTGTMADAKAALKALELLGKTIGAFVDRSEVAVTSIKVVREDLGGNTVESIVTGGSDA